VSEAPHWDDAYAEADGLAIEIAVQPAAKSLDRAIGEIIASSILSANSYLSTNGLAGPAQGVVSVRVDNDEGVRLLNKVWRGIDTPTNVLSFPAPDPQPGPDKVIGDIAISYETAAREAAAERKTFRDHVAHLSVHGFLHLLGYDHESDHDAEEMERLERTILARVDVPDPYVAREAEG
jgi:probable rRNA maturation factor